MVPWKLIAALGLAIALYIVVKSYNTAIANEAVFKMQRDAATRMSAANAKRIEELEWERQQIQLTLTKLRKVLDEIKRDRETLNADLETLRKDKVVGDWWDGAVPPVLGDRMRERARATRGGTYGSVVPAGKSDATNRDSNSSGVAK